MLSQLPQRLLPWFSQYRRDLPWRQDRDPYHVWLSEIMLQQTRVEAVKPYYLRFLAALPTVEALAEAPTEQLQKLWEGLGYYSRMRNLQAAAKVICREYGGHFPDTYDAVRSLPGIGPYTAGAICSICFDLPTPAVDGNVLRVCSRLQNSDEPIDKPQTVRRITEELAAVYPIGQCGDFTQALMELGATVCVPNGVPQCGSCPLADLCLAHREGQETELPIKAKRKPRRIERFSVLLLHCNGKFAMLRRPDTGLLAGLWEFPHVPQELDAAGALALAQQWDLHPAELEGVIHRTHIFTHVQWDMDGWYIRCAEEGGGFQWLRPEDAAIPTAFRILLEKTLL